MGVFSALNTAVAGIQAQAFALENISGNIANSQTTGYKRYDTTFSDLVGGGSENPRLQVGGLVQASTLPTNSVQGAIIASDRTTYLAINGDGYFVVKERTNVIDGAPVFSGNDFYTRRGDFTVDKDGYLVNASGYYLSGFDIDPTTGNLTGNVPDVVQITSDFIQASATTEIQYRANLPSYPLTASADSTVPNSELLDINLYNADTNTLTTTNETVAASATTPQTLQLAAAEIAAMTDGDTLTLSDPGVNGGATTTFTYDTGADGSDNSTFGSTTALIAALTGAGYTAADNAGNVDITTAANNTSFTIGSTNELGRTQGPLDSITSAQETIFLDSTIAGGAITVYDGNGSPIDVQVRWAKTQNAGVDNSANDVFEMYYLTNPTATGTAAKWQRVAPTGHDGYQFDTTGQLINTNDESLTFDLTVGGNTLSNMVLLHGQSGLTQYDDPNGTSAITTFSQDGYPAGDLVDVAISDGGRVVASYSNGQTRDLAEIALVNFNAGESLRRVDGGAYLQTSESGEPLYANPSNVVASSLESSNTDIADEFSKLIVTQQAYTANTRIITAADEMLQEAVNIVR